LTIFGVFGNETPLNTSEQPRDLCPSCHKIREKVPGNLGSYPFLKYMRISSLHPDSVTAKILSERKLNSNFTEKLKTLLGHLRCDEPCRLLVWAKGLQSLLLMEIRYRKAFPSRSGFYFLGRGSHDRIPVLHSWALALPCILWCLDAL
jgi:hypothetical protein